jgi:hypothetical protein
LVATTTRGRAPADHRELRRELVPRLQNLGLKILLEPGRFIVGNAGVLITRCLYEKKGSAKTFKIVDAGMNDLIRPALYEGHHEIVPLKQPAGARVTVDVVGPICESGDFFCQNRELPDFQPGDLVALMSAGAYGFVMASNYNSRPLPAEVLVEDQTATVIRKRQPIWAVAAVLIATPAAPLMAQPAAVAEQVGEFRIEAKPRLRPEAREATHAYRYQNFIPPAMRIPDGYIDGGRSMKMHADGQVGSSRELMMVDRRHDARLRKLLDFARTPEIRSLDERQRAVKLADYLEEFSNGKLSRSASSKATDALIPKYRGRGVLIGDVVAMCGGALRICGSQWSHHTLVVDGE